MFILNQRDKWNLEFAERARVDRRRVPITRTTQIDSYLKDYEFFTLAPLYVHAKVNYSMPDQYEKENGQKQRIVVDYRRVIIDGLGKWGQIVEGIERGAWLEFSQFVMSSLFVSLEQSLVWQSRYQNIGLEGTASRIAAPGRLPVSLWVFAPDGNRGRMIVKTGCPATLHWTPPNPKIVQMAEIVLKCKGRIDR